MKERNSVWSVAMSRVTSWVRARTSASSVGGCEVGRWIRLGVSPDEFDRIELRRVGWEQVGAHTALSGEPGVGRALVVSAQPIPGELDRTAHGACQAFDKSDDLVTVVVRVGWR